MVASEFWVEAICTEVVSVIFLLLLVYIIAASRFLPPHKLVRSQIQLTYLALIATLFQCMHSIDIEGAMGIWSAAISHAFQQQITAMLLLTVAVRINATSSALYALLQKPKPKVLAPVTFGVVVAYYVVITVLSIIEICYERTYRPVGDMFRSVYGRAIAFIIVAVLIQLSTIVLYIELHISVRSFIRQLKEKERRDRLTNQLARLHAETHSANGLPQSKPQSKPAEQVPILPPTVDGIVPSIMVDPPRPATLASNPEVPIQPAQVWQVNVHGPNETNRNAPGLNTTSGEGASMGAIPTSPDDAVLIASQWTARTPIDPQREPTSFPESPTESVDSLENQPQIPSALSLRIKELQVGLKKLRVFTIMIHIICLIAEIADIDYFRADPDNPGDSYKLQQYDHYPATYAVYPLCQSAAILLAIYQVWIHPRLLRDLNLPFWHTLWHGVQDSSNRMEQRNLVLDGIEMVEAACPVSPQRQQVQQHPVLPIRMKPLPIVPVNHAENIPIGLQPKALELKKQWELLDVSSVAAYESAGTASELPSVQPTAHTNDVLKNHQPRPSLSPSPFLLLPRFQNMPLKPNNQLAVATVDAAAGDGRTDRRSVDKILTDSESGESGKYSQRDQGRSSGKSSGKSSARSSQPAVAEKHSESSTSDRPSQLPGVMKSQVALPPNAWTQNRSQLPTSGIQDVISMNSYEFDGSQYLMSANHRSPHVVGRMDSVIMVDERAGDDDDEDDMTVVAPDHMGSSGTLSLIVSDAVQAIDGTQHRVVLHAPHAQ